MSQPLTPINASERLPVIDALRGFAVLGILLINVKASSFPIVFDHLFALRLDWIVEKIIYWGFEFLVYGKFFSMFTFLFGLGMAVQMSRAIDKGSVKKFPMVYVRRLLLLLIIGFIHDSLSARAISLIFLLPHFFCFSVLYVRCQKVFSFWFSISEFMCIGNDL